MMARVDVKSGHGAGKPTEKRLEEIADEYAFMAITLGLTWRE